MKILFINESDFNGGAARAMHRLYEALTLSGIEVYILVGCKTLESSKILLYKPGRMEKLLHKMDDSFIRYTKGINQADKMKFYYRNKYEHVGKIIDSLKPDIIHLHWFTEHFHDLDVLKNSPIPIVWTLHDMWSFTGGCNYSGDCKRYSLECGCCPQLSSEKTDDQSKKNIMKKNAIYNSLSALNIISPSNWMKTAADESSLLSNFKISNIPNCIDTTKYKPLNKEYARTVLNIPNDKKILLFAAAGGIENERKGFRYARKVFEKLEGNDYELYVLGGGADFNFNNSKIHSINKLTDDYSLALFYSAGDLFLAPSTQENLANTILESLSCGTPVAAFNTGGNPDLIEHLYNGYLAEPFSEDDLLNGVKTILENKSQWGLFSDNARKKVENTFTYNKVAGEHIELYNEIISRTDL